ncbi:MAG: pirin, partial [Micrococcales bacterium]|nr:pirin [Micrococcales bacterium]
MSNKLISREALDKLITEALAIEAEEAKSADALGFMARAMVQATLPHKKAEGNEFTRTNG